MSLDLPKKSLEYLPCMVPDRIKRRQNGRRIKNHDEPMFTLTVRDRHGVVQLDIPKKDFVGDDINHFILEHIKIRRITPLECFRLQGMSDDKFYKAQAAIINARMISDAQLYKIAGNGVVVPVVRDIAVGFVG